MVGSVNGGKIWLCKYCNIFANLEFIEIKESLFSSMKRLRHRCFPMSFEKEHWLLLGMKIFNKSHCSSHPLVIYFITFREKSLVSLVLNLFLISTNSNPADTKTLQRRCLNFGLKDVLDWFEMEVTTTFS